MKTVKISPYKLLRICLQVRHFIPWLNRTTKTPRNHETDRMMLHKVMHLDLTSEIFGFPELWNLRVRDGCRQN